MRTVNVQEAKTNLSRLLRQVEAGEEIAIARAGRVIAHLTRAEGSGQRRWRTFEGRAYAAPGAFDPLEDEEAAAWDAGTILP